MKKGNTTFKELHMFLLLWSTQSLSSLGTAMTSYAFIIWSYQQTGSATTMGLMTFFTYMPYVTMSLLAGAYSDRWDKKRTMLVCDSLAAVMTLLLFGLFATEQLEIWHLYVINALNGLLNTFQQPASDVAVTLLTPKHAYQRVSGLRSFSNSLVSVLTPVLATSLLTLTSMEVVLLVDLGSFCCAFFTLVRFIQLPPVAKRVTESTMAAMKESFAFLKQHRGILELILFLAGINFVAAMCDTALPALVLSVYPEGETVLGWVNACAGAASLVGSFLVTLSPRPKNRMTVIYVVLLFSMGTENFMLALSDSPAIWCVAAVLGWLFTPFMSANMDVLLRSMIPLELQGRIYSIRNTLQFFTIPIGHFLAGVLIDYVLNPLMKQPPRALAAVFGASNGAGSALLLFILGFLGVAVCLFFMGRKELRRLGTVTIDEIG